MAASSGPFFSFVGFAGSLFAAIRLHFEAEEQSRY